MDSTKAWIITIVVAVVVAMVLGFLLPGNYSTIIGITCGIVAGGFTRKALNGKK